MTDPTQITPAGITGRNRLIDASAPPEEVDIAFVLEGTYPYIRGGVSSWVDQIIRAFPQYRFGIIFIGGCRSDYGCMAVTLPDNVVHLEEHYLYEPFRTYPATRLQGNAESCRVVRRMHEAFQSGDYQDAMKILTHDVTPCMHDGGPLDERHFLRSKAVWDYVSRDFDERCTDPSFTDYFWTVRTMHRPLWTLLDASRTAVRARTYHSVSTGYAGFLGALLRKRHDVPLLVSEHGIYTKERQIDLMQSSWIQDNRGVSQRDAGELGYLHHLWIRFFQSLGRMCYESADAIVALYEGNRQRQIADGAPAEKTSCIPNGIDVARYARVRQDRLGHIPPVVALIGRLVPIKDIKTFIRATVSAHEQCPALQGWIIGPDTEDPDYAMACRELVHSLGAEDVVLFLGYQDVAPLLPQIGLVVLSSISEALPLVVLEAFAAGIPVVATDVGSCRDLVFGLEGADRALGPAGSVVSIANPAELAQAMLRLLQSPQLWTAARDAAIARAEQYYTSERMHASYDRMYRTLLEKPVAAAQARAG